MAEQLKFIVNGLNNELNTYYDLIEFDSLNEIQHLQILVDVLAHYEAGEAFDLNEEEHELVPEKLFNMLRNVKYKPDANVDISTFCINLINGERTTIFTILQWLFENSEKAKRSAYLAQFVHPNISKDIVDFSEVHDQLVKEFTILHRLTSNLEQSSPSEIINDLTEMALETDAVIKLFISAQLNFIDRPSKNNMLLMAKNLRVEQDKFKKLNAQILEQKDKLQIASEQLQRKLTRFRGQMPAPETANDLIQNIHEELKVNEYLVKKKIPIELSYIDREVKLMQTLQDFGHIQRENLVQIQEKIDDLNQEIKTFMQKQLAMTDLQDDKLTPFNHQITVIKQNKETVGEKLEELKETCDLEAKLTEKQAQVKNLLGDTEHREEELKKYVNKLRGKNKVYKKQRSTLSALKAEATLLTRTLEILQLRDSSLEMTLLDYNKMNINLDKTPQEITTLVEQLSNKLISIKREMSPLENELNSMREGFQQLEQTYDPKKRVYDSTSINLSSQLKPSETDVIELPKKIDSEEDEWRILRQRIEKAEDVLAVIHLENTSCDSSLLTLRQPFRSETLQIHQQEKQAAMLKEEEKFMSEHRAMLDEQSLMWSHMTELLDRKIKNIEKQGSAKTTEDS